MKHYYQLFILSVFFLMLQVSHVKGQSMSERDSLLQMLTSIKSSTDSANFIASFTQIYWTAEEVLLQDEVFKTLNGLKKVLNDEDYCDLIMYYFQSLSTMRSAADNEKLIELEKQWIHENEQNPSRYVKYSWMTILRNIRLPFRNSGKHQECVRFFLEAEQRYQAAFDSSAVSICCNVLSGSYFRIGLIEKSKYYQLKSISYLNDKQEDYSYHQTANMFGKSGKVNRFAVLGNYYVSMDKPYIGEVFLRDAIKIFHELDEPMLMSDAPFLFVQMARCKTLEKSDSTDFYYKTAFDYLVKYESSPIEFAHFYQEKCADFLMKNQLDSALIYIDRTVEFQKLYNLGVSSYFGELIPAYYKSRILSQQGKIKEAITILSVEIEELKRLNVSSVLNNEFQLLSEIYHLDGNDRLAYETLKEVYMIREKILDEESNARTLSYETEKKMEEDEGKILLLNSENQSNTKIKYYLSGIVGLLVLFVIGLAIFYYNKRKNNRVLALNNERLQLTIHQLNETQAQLIQSEKMASLGELTAGIAHEIQNPLNFVNNFSEINQELLQEMKEEILKGNLEEVKQLADDVIDNETKINHHGRRADSIVKGMLQHSRTSSGVKESTDINALADEYLRLAYHGLRAKDKSFNATMKTDFDESIGKIKVVPQDIGRVILNLITNAFHAVDERKKKEQTGFIPVVAVTTKKVGASIEVLIQDNGNGIPKEYIDKIFQPFFTTKPTGQGTGLGLSLSYDIVKAHGGQLKVETKEKEGTTFTVSLPIQMI
jgi:signal transduction histidine kinase